MGSPRPLASRWILVLSPPRERPRALSSEPLFAARGRLLMGSHDGRIQHQVRILTVRNQIGKQTVPNPRLGPAHESLVHALVLAIPLRHVRPAHPRAHHPKHRIHKPPVILCRTTHRPRPPRQKRLHSPPLRLRQLIPCRCHLPTATTSTPERK